MQTKISLPWSALIIGIMTFMAASAIISASPSQSAGPASVGNQFTQNLTVGIPIRLKIPKINVDARLERVGLTSEGRVGAPEDPADAAWFDRWPRPGEEGNAIIDGHFGWKGGLPAVFDNLSKLEKGDKVYVEDEKGVTIAFVVRELRTYSSKANAADVFISKDGKAHLNLITCEGTWNKTEKSYSDRLVVFTDRE